MTWYDQVIIEMFVQHNLEIRANTLEGVAAGWPARLLGCDPYEHPSSRSWRSLF